ncbi:MAG: mechanosensitive ion channel family protein [Rubrobacteraceae bacterium]
MNPLFLALLQETTSEKTSGIEEAADAAGDVAADAGRDTFAVFEVINTFFADALDYVTSSGFISNVIASLVVVALGILVYRVLTHGVPRVLRWRRGRREFLDAEAVARIKRQDTAIALFRNVLRYVMFVIIVLFVLSIFVRNPLPATAGATILAAVLGFGAQSFLRDIIAGFSIIFEGQYSVGDFVRISPPQGVEGVVEEVGLRVTKIRALSGEVHYVPNGMIQGVTNFISGKQRFTLEVQLNDAEAASRVLSSLDEASDLYLTPPRLVGREESDGRVRLRIRAAVLPSMSWLVEDNLTGRIKAAAGEECLAAEPLIYKVDQSSLRRIRSLIPDEEQRKD